MPLDVDAVPVAGIWWRHTYPGSPALPKRDPAPDARWQRGAVVDALYLADARRITGGAVGRPRRIAEPPAPSTGMTT